MAKNYYIILGLPADATPDDIKSDESSHLLSVNRWTSMPAKITKPIPWMSFSGAGRL